MSVSPCAAGTGGTGGTGTAGDSEAPEACFESAWAARSAALTSVLWLLRRRTLRKASKTKTATTQPATRRRGLGGWGTVGRDSGAVTNSARGALCPWKGAGQADGGLTAGGVAQGLAGGVVMEDVSRGRGTGVAGVNVASVSGVRGMGWAGLANVASSTTDWGEATGTVRGRPVSSATKALTSLGRCRGSFCSARSTADRTLSGSPARSCARGCGWACTTL